MKNLKGKVAVVTGAASGIGLAMAARFAREGMKLVLADVEDKPLAEARDAIAKAGAEAIAVRADVSKAKDVDEVARRALEAFGSVHVVCNNAGVGAGGPIWEIPVADWDWVLGVNLMGVVHGIRAFVPRMIAQGEGHVVNTASIAGLTSTPGMAPYCATKHAVVAMSEILHYDLEIAAPGKVGVSVLCPFWVKTKIVDSDRNRPASAPKVDAPRTERQEMIETMVRAAVANAMPPEVVAEKVLNAIVNDKFWIITHPSTKKVIEKRMTGIVEERQPQFEVPEADEVS